MRLPIGLIDALKMPESTLPDADAAERERILRALSLNVVAGVFGMSWVAAAMGMPLPLFFEAIGASGRQLGLVGSLRQISLLFQLPSALLLERLSRRKQFWFVVAVIHRMLWVVPVVAIWLWPGNYPLIAGATLIAFGLSDALANCSTAAWFSWMADLVPAEKGGQFWGRRQRIHSFTLLVIAMGYGWILDRFPSSVSLTGFCIVFLIASFGGTADIILHYFVHEPPQIPHPVALPLGERLAAPLRDPVFRRLTLAMAVWSCAIAIPGITNGLPGFFNILFLKEAFGASYSEASLVFMTSAIGAVVGAPTVGHAMDRFGARRVAVWLMRSGSLFTITWLFTAPGRWEFGSWSVPQAVAIMSIASLGIGACYCGVYICHMRLTALYTRAAGRTVSMAVHWSLVGLLASIGPIVGGTIRDFFPKAWAQPLLPHLAPFSYFHVIVLLQIVLIWALVIPLLHGVKDHEASSK